MKKGSCFIAYHLLHKPFATMTYLMCMVIFACLCGTSALHGKVLATVDGTQITDDVFNEIRAQNPGFDYDRLPKEQQKDVINGLIDRALIINDARTQKLNETLEFKNALEKFTQNIATELLAEIWQRRALQDAASKIAVNEQEARTYYDSHLSEFNKPNARVRHILVKTEAEASKIISELNKTPKNKVEAKFIELANKQTIDPATKQAQNGGDLGVLDRDMVVKPFADAVFAMSPGSYSKTPIKTDFGYHVIYLVSKADKYDFDNVKNVLMDRIRQQKIAEAMQSKLKSLRAKAKITIN